MSNKSLPVKKIIISLLGIIIILIGLYVLYRIGAFTVMVERNFQDWQLLITENDLPVGWELIEEYTSINDSEGQKSGAEYIWGYKIENKSSRMWERIYHYSSEEGALWKFQQWSDLYIPSDKDEEVMILEGYDLSQLHANAWEFGCKNDAPTEVWIRCSYIAQYDEFMLVFGVIVKINNRLYISSEDLYAVIIRIDEKISSYLNMDD